MSIIQVHLNNCIQMLKNSHDYDNFMSLTNYKYISSSDVEIDCVNVPYIMKHYKNKILNNVSMDKLKYVHPSNLIILSSQPKNGWVRIPPETRDRIIGIRTSTTFYPVIYGYTIMNNLPLFKKGLKYGLFRGLICSMNNDIYCIDKSPVVLVYDGIITNLTLRGAKRICLAPPELHSTKEILRYKWPKNYNHNLLQLDIPLDYGSDISGNPNLMSVGNRFDEEFLQDDAFFMSHPDKEFLNVNDVPSWNPVLLSSKKEIASPLHAFECGYEVIECVNTYDKACFNNDIQYKNIDRKPRNTIRRIRSQYR